MGLPGVITLLLAITWRIVLGRTEVVNNHGDPKSPEDRLVGPLPNGLNAL